MSRLRRFPEQRWIGTRDDMVAHDCDDDAQFAALQERMEMEDLLGSLGISTFGPDTLEEARNRGFIPPR